MHGCLVLELRYNTCGVKIISFRIIHEVLQLSSYSGSGGGRSGRRGRSSHGSARERELRTFRKRFEI